MGTVSDFNETAKLIMELIASIRGWKSFPEQSKIQSLVLSLQSQYSSALSENLELKEIISKKSQESIDLREQIIHLKKKDDNSGFSSGVVISEH